MSFRLPVLRFALMLGLAAASGFAANQVDLEALFRAANEKLNAGNYVAAVEDYNAILEARPKSDNVWAARGLAKMQLKDLSGARADFAQAIALNPKHPDAFGWRGALRFSQKDFAGAVDDFTAAIAAEPDMAVLYGSRAEAYHALGKNESALSDLNRAIELDLDFIPGLYLRAQIYEENKDVSAALADYNRIIRLQPDHADALNQRSWLKFYRHDWPGAIEDARKVLAVAPLVPIAIRLIGYAQFGLGDYAAAAATLAKAADLETDDPSYALFIRHHALLRTGAADKRLATTWGKWADKPWQQAIARFIVGQISEDEFEAAALQADNPDDLPGQACEMHFYIGLARLHAGDKSTAKLRFQSARAQNVKTFIEDALSAAELTRLAK